MPYTFYMLAERSGLTALLFAAGITAIAALVPLRTSPAVIMPTPVPPKLESSTACPAHVRAALHVDDRARLECMPVDHGTFAVARYHTTEAWDRMAIVAPDGTLFAPLADQPSLPVRASLDTLLHQYVIAHGPRPSCHQ